MFWISCCCLCCMQVELYEHAQIMGNLMSKGPVPGVDTYCIYGAGNQACSGQHVVASMWCQIFCYSGILLSLCLSFLFFCAFRRSSL